MQTNKIIKILAINPGTRYIGFAVFYGPELRDWGTKVVKGKWSVSKKEKLKGIVQSFIDQHQPDAITIKRLHPSRSSTQLNSLINEIKLIAGNAGLSVYEYPIKYIEAHFSPKKPINKTMIGDLLAPKYPVLYHDFKSKSSDKNSYYLRMIEAVALGFLVFQHLDRAKF